MTVAFILQNVSWGLTTALEIALIGCLLRRKLYRSHPFFFAYILSALAQSAVVAMAYRMFGADSHVGFVIAWGSQGVVVLMRWLAVVEIARLCFRAYSGIWAITNRMLLLLGICGLLYAATFSRIQWIYSVLNADRAVELCSAVFIVGMFLFVRYYRVPLPPLERMLAIGFCLYSCFSVINDSLYESWHRTGGPLWNDLGMVTFMASLSLWLGAVLRYSQSTAPPGTPEFPVEAYAAVSQQLNTRLHLLNNRLDQLFHSQDSRP